MEIKDLIEITPEIKAEIHKMLEASRTLEKLIGNSRHYMLEASSTRSELTIFDRHEYGTEGEDLGFYVHRFYSDDSDDAGTLDFIAEDTREARAFDEAFNKALEQGQEAENGKNE